MFKSYEIFYERTRKRGPFNTGDYLIEVTAWAGLTVYKILWEKKDQKHQLIYYNFDWNHKIQKYRVKLAETKSG